MRARVERPLQVVRRWRDERSGRSGGAGLLPVRLHRHQRRDDGQRAAHPVPGHQVRADHDPVHRHRRARPRGGRDARRPDGRPGHAAGVHDRGRGRGARGAQLHPRAPHRLLRHAHAARRVGARHDRAPRGGPPPRRRRHPALQQPDGRGGVRHRARRRAEPARTGPLRRDPAGALTLRQDPHEHVPRAAARAVRGQLPPRRRGPRALRAARRRSRRTSSDAGA